MRQKRKVITKVTTEKPINYAKAMNGICLKVAKLSLQLDKLREFIAKSTSIEKTSKVKKVKKAIRRKKSNKNDDINGYVN